CVGGRGGWFFFIAGGGGVWGGVFTGRIRPGVLRGVFLGGLVVVFIEVGWCFPLGKGRGGGRWLFLLQKITAASYLWAASLGYGYPELFSIPGESKREIFHSLMLQKLPDMLILMLLFVPSTSRRFFQLQ
ncbi:DUF2593 family protein, partial [Escherichia coli]|nr:DUF2593 family protein [Escherichia coli]